MPHYKKSHKGKTLETKLKETPKYIQVSEYDFVFACELLNRMGVEYVVIPTNKESKDYLFEDEICSKYGLVMPR